MWGLEEWVAEGGHRVGGGDEGWWGSLALNLFHMTHAHMASVWTLSVCLSVCLPTSLSHSLSLGFEGKEVGGGGVGGAEGGVEVDISQPQQELCDDRGQAMSHTRDSGGSPYHAERASLNTPLLSLPISLFVCRAQQKQHTC